MKVIKTGDTDLILKEFKDVESSIDNKNKDKFYSDSWELSAQISNDIDSLESQKEALRELYSRYKV